MCPCPPGALANKVEFGEAHFAAIGLTGDVYVADSVNGALVKFVRR